MTPYETIEPLLHTDEEREFAREMELHFARGASRREVVLPETLHPQLGVAIRDDIQLISGGVVTAAVRLPRMKDRRLPTI